MTAAVFLVSLLAAVSPSHSIDPLSLHVTPRACLTPGFIRAEARVMRHPDNRQLVLVADSIAYYSSATKDIDGDHDTVVHEMLFKQLPAGIYTISARLTWASGEEYVRDALVEVRGSNIPQ